MSYFGKKVIKNLDTGCSPLECLAEQLAENNSSRQYSCFAL